MPEKIECRVRFVTPAFLGNAEQKGQWRMPPFKALLRQWWRVAYAADYGFNVDLTAMRREEGMLFGNAWLSHQEGGRTITDHRKSLVRLRLDTWQEGKLRSWNGLEQETVYHPETERTHYKVGPQAYLGYGPLDGRGGTKFTEKNGKKSNAAIQAGETATLSIAWPQSHRDHELNQLLRDNTPRLRQALLLMHHFGTLGGRSRNGWGSFSFEPVDEVSRKALEGHSIPLHPWTACLSLDWPHAIGQDKSGPLVWQTAPHDDWKKLMQTLAIVKIGMRTQFLLTMNTAQGDKPIMRRGEQVGINHGQPQPRHWLSFPITNHPVSPWGGKARLPNSMRFKVRPVPGDPRKLVGVIFHAPCLPPSGFNPNQVAITQTWQSVHSLLNELTKSAESRQYLSIRDTERRGRLMSQLNSVTLQRIQE